MSEGDYPRSEAPGELAEIPAEPRRSLEPVAAEERMEIIDVLRGIALLGILFVNMQFYTTPFSAFMMPEIFWSEPHDTYATSFIQFFCQGKFYTLFSFLFGLGISIQLLRAQERGKPFLGYHFRRMAVLLVIGLIHAYGIWMGDILVTYALLGFIMPLFIRCRPRTLLIWALAILLLMTLAFAAGAGLCFLGSFFSEAGTELPTHEKLVERLRNAGGDEIITYGRGSYWDITWLRARQTVSSYIVLLIYQGPHSLAMFLLGMFVGKSRWFHDLPASLPWFRRAWLFGLIVGLGGTALTYWCMSNSSVENMSGLTMKLSAISLSTITAPALSCFYACSIVLLYQYDIVRRLLSPISAVGQMVLTNYLAQSVICSTLFYGSTLFFGIGFGYYAQIGPAAGLGLTVLIWVVELVWSNLWLRVLKFRFGPMEWLWRTLSYGRLQPIR